MDTEQPDAVLRRHGVEPRRARCIANIALTETQPRIFAAIDIRGITNRGRSVIRTAPWPHVEAYNALVRTVCTADSDATAIDAAVPAKPQILRRMNVNTGIFSLLGHPDFDARLYDMPDMTPPERAAARTEIAGLLAVDPAGEPAGAERVPWLGDWALAVSRTWGQFMSVSRIMRGLHP